jgi:predicted RNA-binding Zn-ribbon protein involved in translation (DUF1610 family)
LASKMCPDCSAYLYRSHTRGFKEKIVRVFSSYKIYRCHDCGWRGWFGRSKTTVHQNRYRLLTVISVLITLLITLLLAFYLIERISAPAVHLPLPETLS